MRNRIVALVTVATSLICGGAHGETARDWIIEMSGREGEWIDYGEIIFPSGQIFIGDPSWGGDYHMRGAKELPVDHLRIWMYVSEASNPKVNQVQTVWLEALGTTPKKISSKISFGTDSAYFAFGDARVGYELTNIGDLGIAQLPDSFEFFLPHIQNYGFTGISLEVPPNNSRVFAVETKRDGGLEAVWTEDVNGEFSGILIDVTGRVSDGIYLDKLIRP